MSPGASRGPRTRRLAWALPGAAALALCLIGVAEAGPRRLPAAGTRIQLNEPLRVPAGTARVFIQFGKVRPHRELNTYETYCKFFVPRSRTELAEPYQIEADEFTVTKAQRGRDEFADASGAFRKVRDGTTTTLVVRMKIRSERQPMVAEFICARFGSNNFYDYPTVAEMKSTLGGLVTLTEPPPD